MIGSSGGAGDTVQGNGDIPHHPQLQVRQSSKEGTHEEDENGKFKAQYLYSCVFLICHLDFFLCGDCGIMFVR